MFPPLMVLYLSKRFTSYCKKTGGRGNLKERESQEATKNSTPCTPGIKLAQTFCQNFGDILCLQFVLNVSTLDAVLEHGQAEGAV